MTPKLSLFLTVDGCPYAFASQSPGTITWPAGEEPRGVQVLPYVLDDPRVSWTETLHPNDGDLEYSGFSLRLHDAAADVSGVTTGPAQGVASLASYLCTRRVSTLMQVALGADVVDIDTTIHLAAVPAGMPSSNFVLWIDQEAILCSTRSSTTCTVASSGRGYYGTAAREHVAYNGVAPLAFVEFPGVLRRRCSLFVLDETDTAHLLWRGYCARAPRVSDARVELPLQSIWEVERNLTLGYCNASTRLRGFDSHAFWVRLRFSTSDRPYSLGDVATYPLFASLDSLCNAAMANLATNTVGVGGFTAAEGHAVRLPQGLRLSLDAVGDAGSPDFTLYAGIHGDGDLASAQSTRGSASTRHVELVLSPAPTAAILCNPGGAQPFPLSTTAGLPTSWDSVSPVSDAAPYSAQVRPILSAPYGEDGVALDLVPSVDAALSDDDATVALGGPTFVGTARLRRGLAALEDRVGVLTQAYPFRLAYEVTGTHWAVALETALVDRVHVRSASDSRNWDWSTLPLVFAATDNNAQQNVQWFLDGTQKLDDFVRGLATLNGCALAVRGGKLALVPVRWATATETAVATIERTDVVNDEKPTWTVNEDGLVNVVHCKGSRFEITTRDARSVAANGEGRTVELDVSGLVDDSPVLANPLDFASSVLSRVLGLFAETTYFTTVTVAWTQWWNLYLGDLVTLSSWLVPDGLGGRGLAGRAATVIGRDVNLERNELKLTLLLLDQGVGYSPCVRIASVDESGLVLTIAGPGYIAGSDYARSDDVDYQYAATSPNDGGTAHFAVGFRVEALQRNASSPFTHNAGVAAVDPLALTITLDDPLTSDLQTALSGGGIVDLRFSNYGDGITDAQKLWAWVGNTSEVIPPSSDPAQPWSP